MQAKSAGANSGVNSRNPAPVDKRSGGKHNGSKRWSVGSRLRGGLMGLSSLALGEKERKAEVGKHERTRSGSAEKLCALSVLAILDEIGKQSPELRENHSKWFEEQAVKLLRERSKNSDSVSQNEIDEIVSALIEKKVKSLNNDLIWAFVDAHSNAPLLALIHGHYEGESACYVLSEDSPSWPRFSKTELEDIKDCVRRKLKEEGARLGRVLTEEEGVTLAIAELNAFNSVRSASLGQQLPALRKIMPEQFNASQCPFDAVRASLNSFVFAQVDVIADESGSYTAEKLRNGVDILGQEKFGHQNRDALASRLRSRLSKSLDPKGQASEFSREQGVRLLQWKTITEIIRDIEKATHTGSHMCVDLPIETLIAYRRTLDRWALITRESGLDWTQCPAFNALRHDLEKLISDSELVQRGLVFPDVEPDASVPVITYMMSRPFSKGDEGKSTYLDIEERRAFAEDANRSVFQYFPSLAGYKFSGASWGLGFDSNDIQLISDERNPYRFPNPRAEVAWTNIGVFLEKEGVVLDEADLDSLRKDPVHVAMLTGSFAEPDVDLDVYTEALANYHDKFDTLCNKLWGAGLPKDASPIALLLIADLTTWIRKCIAARDAIAELRKLKDEAQRKFEVLIKLRDEMVQRGEISLETDTLKEMAFCAVTLYNNSEVPRDPRRLRLEIKRVKQVLIGATNRIMDKGHVPKGKATKATADLLRAIEFYMNQVKVLELVSADPRGRKKSHSKQQYPVKKQVRFATTMK